MKLRVRHLRLRASTSNGTYGADLPFDDGLVIVRGKNTSGKTTAMKAILYGLGLEGMLSPTKVPPFADVLLRRLQGETGEVDVVGSYVELEIENEAGRRITCTRAITGQAQDNDIIEVTNGPKLTGASSSLESRGYYVRLRGAATRNSGFHTFLAEFVGWELPQVPRFDSEPGPLYMECLFPFFFVDQITGWRGVHARMPTFLGIPEVWNRAIEFVMRLDCGDLPLRRFLIEQRRQNIQARWQSAIEHARIEVRGLGVMPKGLPTEPTATWPPPIEPSLVVISGTEWLPIETARQRAQKRLAELDQREIPQVRDVASQLAAEVEETESRLLATQRQQTQLHGEVAVESEYVVSLEARLAALEDDLRKNQDELTIRQKGSVGDRNLLSPDCPVCHRPRSDSLLSQTVDITPMPVEANIAYIKAEIGLFREMRADQSMVIEGKQQRLGALRQMATDLESLLREQRRALRADGELPSSAAIRERIQAEEVLNRLQTAEQQFLEVKELFAALASEWVEAEASRLSLKARSESSADAAKRSALEESFKEQLVEYGFSSFGKESIAHIKIDPVTIRPTKEGFDLGEMSASDTIRCVWAYLLGILECAREFQINHPGLLIMDEPRQQSASPISFAALIGRAGSAGTYGQQVIFATSEESAELLQAMRSAGGTVIELPEKLLVRLTA